MNISEVMPNGNVRVIVPISLRKTVHGRVITVAENIRTVQGQSPLLAAIGSGPCIAGNIESRTPGRLGGTEEVLEN